ncbi:MAG: PLP-dependent aminotransferase family protein [Chloroflexota bacterium]|nr:MAG: PLP-dependent aminotransferase family protein [Chloroflexota bacterium]HDD61371.1 PLP-dependent aminotransferase family protein [Chloroflexota bacterium]
MELPIVQTDVPPGFIDLGSGNPGLEMLPMEMIAHAAERYFEVGDRHTLQYGAEQGNGLFLSALAEFLSSKYGFSVAADKLLATTGASSALDLLCTLFTQPGDAIIVEEPTYFLALGIFADHRLNVYAVPLDQEGLDVDSLEALLVEIQPKFVYTIPTFHNPASTTLSEMRREKLVSLAQEYDFLLIADEVYHFLAYAEEPPPPLAEYSDQAEQVVSINSFSKILAPGLRLGWIQAHPKMISRLVKCGLLDSGGGLNPFTSAIVQYLIESGDLTKNIRQLQDVFQQRQEAMSTALDRYLPGIHYNKPQGGYYFWVHMPERDTVQLRNIIHKNNIDIRPGSLFSSQNGLNDYLRLSISNHNPEQIETGIKILARSMQES